MEEGLLPDRQQQPGTCQRANQARAPFARNASDYQVDIKAAECVYGREAYPV